ncbi:MAG: carbohydrate binding domain-containing protein [Planctomycetaceae bacterium]|nr:carbohydrate binding domain-containing protein [Planctomycetaceae bacterium]
MKMFIVSFVFLVLFALPVQAENQSIPLKAEKIWSREPNTATIKIDGDMVNVEAVSSQDWAVVLSKAFPAEAGETFLLSATIRNFKGSGNTSITAALFGSDGKIIDWTLASDSLRGETDQRVLETEFVVPAGNGYKIMPRLVGHGQSTFSASDFSLIKTGKIELNIDQIAKIPAVGKGRFEYPVASENVAKSWLLRSRGKLSNALSVDNSVKFNGNATLLIEGNSERKTTLFPQTAIAVKSGEQFFVSFWVKLDRGKVSLEILPCKSGLASGSRIANGTFAPSVFEEGNDWANVHVYLTIPEGVDSFCPVISADPDTVFRIGELSIERPSPQILKQSGKKVNGFARERIEEKLDRGLVALKTADGVYLSWRLLNNDKPDTEFHVYRINPDGKEIKLTDKPVTKTTDFIDKTVPNNGSCQWFVRVGENSTKTIAVTSTDKPYLSIPLKNEKSFQFIAFADLDGDHKLDYVIKSPNSNIDPYINYWKESSETFRLQAYNANGQFLWEKDLGWGIERGIWYSPYIVADLDGDGCAEVAVKTAPPDFDPRNVTKRVYSGAEYLSILDGKTGKERTKIDWPDRNGLSYNTASRNQLCVAYLDGKTPAIIVLRGTYTRMIAIAYQFCDNKLEELWRFDNRWQRELWGQGAHTTHAVDLDGDGRDEVILGSTVLDDDGSVLWCTKLGHPDHVYIGDLDPQRPGLEIFYGIETRQPKNGICMVDSKNGEFIWGIDFPTTHIHGQGFCSDIDASQSGYELWNGERDSEELRWLRNVKGEVLDIPEQFSRKNLNPDAVWWDADLQRELIHGGRPVDFPSYKSVDVDTMRFEGRIRLIGDVLGDWREEVVTSHNGEIRIYTTTIPATDRRNTFLQDANYRATLRENTMGYPQIPVPSYELK